MKSVIKELDQESLTFPLLMIDKEDNMIVLVTKEEGGIYTGTILHKGTNSSSNADLQVGSFNNGLSSKYFIPFTDSLHLFND